MKNVIITALVLVSMIICFVGGFTAGIRKATTSNGWIEGHEFVLNIDGNIFAWEIEEE